MPEETKPVRATAGISFETLQGVSQEATAPIEALQGIRRIVTIPLRFGGRLLRWIFRQPESHAENTHTSIGDSHHGIRHHVPVKQILDVGTPIAASGILVLAWARRRLEFRRYR
jgi:hypothetical protein